MKKKISKWFVGLWMSFHGFIAVGSMAGVMVSFIFMISSVGWEFIASFVCFILCLVASIFLPYGIFKEFKDVVKNEDK